MGGSIRGATIRIVTHLFFFIFLAQIATAFPCERFGWFSSCDAVMLSSMPEDEKMTTIASMIDDVRAWNTDFDVSSPPEGTNVVNDDLVQNAWIRIMAVMPSVYEGNVQLSPGFGEVVAKSNYDLVRANQIEGDDCDTQYDLNHQSRIVQYLNGQEIGVGETARFDTIDSVLDFRADLVVDAELMVDHYRWTFINDTEECVYSGTEQRNKQTVASDTLRVVRYAPNIAYSFQIENEYYGITQIHFSASNYSSLKIKFNNQEFYEEHLVDVDPFFTLEPYYVLNFKPVPQRKITFNGVRFQNSTFQVANTQGCTIVLGDYFRNYTIPCPLQYKQTDLRISTDKSVYSPDEIIKVTISSDLPVQVSYGNETATVQRMWEVPAKLGEQLIVARANGVETYTAISVLNSELWGKFAGIVAFLFVAFIFYRVTVRLFGGAYDLWNS